MRYKYVSKTFIIDIGNITPYAVFLAGIVHSRKDDIPYFYGTVSKVSKS